MNFKLKLSLKKCLVNIIFLKEMYEALKFIFMVMILIYTITFMILFTVSDFPIKDIFFYSLVPIAQLGYSM